MDEWRLGVGPVAYNTSMLEAALAAAMCRQISTPANACRRWREAVEADMEVAWLTRWRATRDGSPRLLSYGHNEQEKGDLLSEHA